MGRDGDEEENREEKWVGDGEFGDRHSSKGHVPVCGRKLMMMRCALLDARQVSLRGSKNFGSVIQSTRMIFLTAQSHDTYRLAFCRHACLHSK